MRPYLAVIADSFRAAFTSRVLWVAIAAIYLFLFAIAPIGYREVFTTTIRWFDLSNGTRMKAMLAQDIGKAKPTPAGMIARAMPEEIQNNLRKVAEGEEVRIQLDLLASSLTALLDKDDWYDEAVWKNTNRMRELRELDAQSRDQLSDELRKRQARLRIEAALPGVFENRGARSMALTYAGFNFPAVFQLEPAQFKLLLNHVVLRLIIDWVLGFVMIFLGILVTAAIVPDMLQPGSLHLLLSKPVSRTLLFLAKFIGGCAFVFVCVTQLIIGLWLISGFRLGLWNARLLLCIPVCVFLFAVFYSVSAVAGLRWRSPILSIGLANAFGALCLLIGVAGGVSDGFISGPDRIEALSISGDTIIASTQGADLRRYDREQKSWVDLFPDDSGGGDRILPPVKLSDGRIVTARVRGGRMNMFGSGATSLLVLDRRDEWKPTPSIELPTSTAQLFTTPQGELVAVNSSEFTYAAAESFKPTEGSEQKAAPEDANIARKNNQGPEATGAKWLPKLMKMMGGATKDFHPLAPREVSVSPPRSIAFTADGNSVFIYSSSKLLRLDRPQDDHATSPWTIASQADFDADNKQVWIRRLGKDIALLRSETSAKFFDSSLAPMSLVESVPFDLSVLKIKEVVSCGESDALAIVTADGTVLMLFRDDASHFTVKAIVGLSEIDTVTWDGEAKRLWLSHHVDCIAAYDVEKKAIIERIQPRLQGWRLVDRYAVTPLRTITPQTGELGETIATLVSGESSIQFPIAPEESQSQRYHIWRPVLTCAGFIAVMLTIGCVYFSRADF